jgi:hypothetical protein
MHFALWRDFASWDQGLERQHSGDRLLSTWKRGDVRRGRRLTLLGKPGDHPELGEHSSSNDQFVKIYLLLNSSR